MQAAVTDKRSETAMWPGYVSSCLMMGVPEHAGGSLMMSVWEMQAAVYDGPFGLAKRRREEEFYLCRIQRPQKRIRTNSSPL